MQTKGRIEAALHHFDGPDQAGDALQGIELALQRDEHRICGNQPVQGEQAEAWRAVDEHETVRGGTLAQGNQGIAQAVFAAIHPD